MLCDLCMWLSNDLEHRIHTAVVIYKVFLYVSAAAFVVVRTYLLQNLYKTFTYIYYTKQKQKELLAQ